MMDDDGQSLASKAGHCITKHTGVPRVNQAPPLHLPFGGRPPYLDLRLGLIGGQQWMGLGREGRLLTAQPPRRCLTLRLSPPSAASCPRTACCTPVRGAVQSSLLLATGDAGRRHRHSGARGARRRGHIGRGCPPWGADAGPPAVGQPRGRPLPSVPCHRPCQTVVPLPVVPHPIWRWGRPRQEEVPRLGRGPPPPARDCHYLVVWGVLKMCLARGCAEGVSHMHARSAAPAAPLVARGRWCVLDDNDYRSTTEAQPAGWWWWWWWEGPRWGGTGAGGRWTYDAW